MATEEMPWGPIRLDGMFKDWTQDDKPGVERKMETDEQRGISIQKVEVVTIRDIKRNAFSASYLKIKQESWPRVRRKNVGGCRSSLLDLTRRQGHLLKQLLDLQVGKKGIRRPRSKRKEDWNLAISRLVGNTSFDQQLIPRAFLQTDHSPLLPSVLGVCIEELLLHSNKLPLKRELRPSRSIVIANVTSNLWFDVEFLSQEVEDAIRSHKGRKQVAQARFLQAIEDSQFSRQGGKRSVFWDAPCFEDEVISKPVVSLTLCEKLNRPDRRGKRISGIGRKSGGPRRLTFDGSDIEIVQRELIPSSLDLDKFMESASRPFQQAFSRINASHIFQLKGHLESTTSQEDGIASFEDSIFSCELFTETIRIEEPVVQQGSISSLQRDAVGQRGESFWPPSRKTEGEYSSLEALNRYTRSLRSFEQGLWCTGSKEILQKSQYSREQLLRNVVKTGPFLLALSENFKRPCSSYQSELFENIMKAGATWSFMGIPCRNDQTRSRTKWKKFGYAVQEELTEENACDLKLRLRSIQDAINAFDPPKRRRSPANFELIRSRYECTQESALGKSHDSSQSNGGRSPGAGGSDESILDDMYLSDEEFEHKQTQATALGTLIAMGTTKAKDHKLKSSNTKQTDQAVPKKGCNVGQKRPDPSSCGFVLSQAKHPRLDWCQVRLRAPDNMVCPPWSLKIAEHCLQEMTRGVVFLPPPLSMLPAVAAIANSFLAENLCDHRVAIICKSDTDTAVKISSYLNFTYGGTVSIDIIRRATSAEFPKLASLTNTMARLVILDSFDFNVSSEFSLLVILGPGTVSLSSLGNASTRSGEAFAYSASHWAGTTSIIIAPNHPYNDMREYSQHAKNLARNLNVHEALFVDERDDIHHSVLLSRPDFLFLVPPREVVEFTAVLETQASSHISEYQTIEHRQRQSSKTNAGIHCLRDVSPHLLEGLLAEKRPPGVNGTHLSLEVLYCLRQARSYALYDGLDTAIQYLSHYALRTTSNVLNALQSLLEELGVAKQPAGEMAFPVHPIARALKRSLRSMKEEMRKQAPSLRSIHRRDQFRPLVITSSKEAFDGLMKGLVNARDILEAEHGDVAVCELRSLSCEKGAGKTSCERGVVEQLHTFSHVYHVIDDRNREAVGLFLPPQLMQYVHAGRTRLQTIAVDETRELEFTWKRNEALYADLSAALRKSIPFQKSSSKDAYMLQIPLEQISLALNTILAPEERVEANSKPLSHGVSTAETSVPKAKTGRHASNSELHLTAVQICRLSIAALQSKMRAKLASIRDKESGVLHVVIHVGKTEACTPAATYIFAALARDDDLRKSTAVKMIF